MAPSATVFSSTVNLVKTIIGAGLLAIPFAFRADGILLGVILIVLAAITSGFGLFVLARSSKVLINPRQTSFFTLCSITYPNVAFLFDFAMFMQCFGVSLSYLILIGDLFPDLFGGNRKWWVLGSGILILPLTHLRSFDSLKYSSLFGILAILYLVAMIVGVYLQGLLWGNEYSPNRGEVRWVEISSFKDLISTFSIMIFAFTASMNIFSIIKELKDNSIPNIRRVINYSVGISTVVFILVGTCGYLSFGDGVDGNVILNYNRNHISTKLAELALGFILIVSFPLLFHPTRVAFNNMIHWVHISYQRTSLKSSLPGDDQSLLGSDSRLIAMTVEDEEDREVLGLENGSYQSLPRGSQLPAEPNEEDDSDTPIVPLDGKRFYLVTWLLIVVLYALALKVGSFALVLAIVGATGSTSISFILPGLFGYKLIGTESLLRGYPPSRLDKFLKNCSLALVIYGVAVTGISLLVIIRFGV
ncbi:HDL228Wp [Eremothecium sinecaudum]|uniref:HDL228Wp n=1 Tax=Eremothecium sinecaudum TaxID=45286 RepID=A0A0X8HR88_9SACH|nr:HDL228Wp [Eremothecium sinecaudum]AMD20516.1 HDL228Wp [Eremothecium sinecaudum]